MSLPSVTPIEMNIFYKRKSGKFFFQFGFLVIWVASLNDFGGFITIMISFSFKCGSHNLEKCGGGLCIFLLVEVRRQASFFALIGSLKFPQGSSGSLWHRAPLCFNIPSLLRANARHSCPSKTQQRGCSGLPKAKCTGLGWPGFLTQNRSAGFVTQVCADVCPDRHWCFSEHQLPTFRCLDSRMEESYVVAAAKSWPLILFLFLAGRTYDRIG